MFLKVPGATIPPLNTHPEIFSFGSHRLATSMEYLGMQGLDVFESLAGKRPLSPIMQCLDGLSEKEIKLFAGNGLHTAVFAAWFFFVLGQCAMRDFGSPSAPLAETVEEEAIDDEVALRTLDTK